jgi:hypothetical protein
MEKALYERILATPADVQVASPLFSIPAEVRGQIFAAALTDHPDPSPDQHYEANTCYTRPSYFAPRKSDARLLRTCRAVYNECWFLPFILRDQTHWLTAQNRAPPEYNVRAANHKLLNTLKHITKSQGGEIPEIQSLRIFAQMYMLEGGHLYSLFKSDYLRPRSWTLTIRHADWWYWEQDEPLRFESKWIKPVSKVMPNSVREIRIELESLQRKKDQINKIATQMVDRWYFKRRDGATLFADATPGTWEVDTWTGSSHWHNQRWVRDETEDGKIDYYIVTVTFRLESALMRRGGKISDTAKLFAQENAGARNEMKLQLPGQGRLQHEGPAFISVPPVQPPRVSRLQVATVPNMHEV